MGGTLEDTLAGFSEFVRLKVEAGLNLSPEMALALWRERVREVTAVREGLDALDRGESRPIADFLRELDDEFGLDDA